MNDDGPEFRHLRYFVAVAEERSFPDSFLADSDGESFIWRTAFIQTYLERDVPALGPRIPAETLRR